MVENISLSFQGIWGHKMRSFLTMLGIIIGIASIITIVSTIKGTNEQIKENLIGSGNNVVTVALCSDGYQTDFSYESVPDGIAPVTEETRAALEDLDGVAEVSLYHTREYADSVYYKNMAFSGNLCGIDSHYFGVYDYQIIRGRGFTDADFSEIRKNAVIDSKTASTLFAGEDPIGKTIEIQGEPYTIVGEAVLRQTSSPTITSYSDYSMYADTSSGTIFIPDCTWAIVYKFDEPQNAAVRADSTDSMTKAGKNVASSLTASQITDTSGTYTYEANDLLEQASDIQALSKTANTQLIWIAGISLLVGGIGVMNIMLVSVTERTREIGLKKALGARRKRILWQFLTEAAVLTSTGGLLGILCGIGLARLLSGIMGMPTAISLPACLIAFFFSMVIGIVFGLMPAVKASRLNPIEALRYE